MRTSRASGIYPVHESDEVTPSDTCVTSGAGTQICTTVIKPRLDIDK